MGTAVAVDVAFFLCCGSNARFEHTGSDKLAVAQCFVSDKTQLKAVLARLGWQSPLLVQCVLPIIFGTT